VRWQIATSINDTSGKFASGVKVNIKAKIYIYVNSTIQRCPNKIIKIFLIEDFFICHRCQRHRWSTMSSEYLREFSKKFETALMVYSGAWGKLIHEKKTRSRKPRGTVPLMSDIYSPWMNSCRRGTEERAADSYFRQLADSEMPLRLSLLWQANGQFQRSEIFNLQNSTV
jgi:hypothetical protein